MAVVRNQLLVLYTAGLIFKLHFAISDVEHTVNCAHVLVKAIGQLHNQSLVAPRSDHTTTQHDRLVA